jgi:predicted protein tyrosine phosphatase
MTSFCNDVADWLITGGDLSLAFDLTEKTGEETAQELIARGVTHVLDVRSEWTDAKVWASVDPTIQYCHAPIVDSHSHYVGESWYRAVEDFVEKFWLESHEGDKLYVHCHMGINRGTSAAMLALLTVDETLDPYDAFLLVREARPIAGLVYAEQVGRRHLKNQGLPVAEFNAKMRDYWSSDRIKEVNRGIAYYRTQEGGTIKVGGQTRLACPVGLQNPQETHRVKWNSGNPICLDCETLAVSVPA